MTQQTYDANSVLMGGGGAPTAKFANPGDSIRGRIIAPPTVYQEREYDPNNPGGGAPKTYPSGDPIMSIYVDLATDLRDPSIADDDGTRRLYIEGRYLKGDIRDAVRTAGAPGLEPGGVLTVTFTHREDEYDKRSRKFWTAQYVPAGNAALMTAAAPAAVAQQQPPAWAQPAPAAAAPAPVAAPAAPAPATETPADLARKLIAVGLDDAQVATATGLDAAVVGALRTAA